MSRRRSSTPSASAATSTSVGRPLRRIVERDLLHHGVHRAALRGAEPATPAAGAIVGTRLLAVARIGGLVVVAVGLTAAHRSTESLAGRHEPRRRPRRRARRRREQRALHQADVGRRPGRIAERLGEAAGRPDPAHLADRAIQLVGLVAMATRRRCRRSLRGSADGRPATAGRRTRPPATALGR